MIPASRKVTSTPGNRPTGSLRIALGERCFRVPPGRRHSFDAPVIGWRLAIAKAIGGLARRNAMPPSGRPVQHLSPITSSARIEKCFALGNLQADAKKPNLIFDN